MMKMTVPELSFWIDELNEFYEARSKANKI